MMASNTFMFNLAGAILTVVAGAFVLKKLLNKERIPKQWRQVGVVKSLFIYPLKSGQGSKAKTLFVTQRAVKETEKDNNSIELLDRSFLIYMSKNFEVRTARQLPKITLISIQAAGNGIILTVPQKNDLYISIPKLKNNIEVLLNWGSTFGKEPFTCTDCGDSAATWLSQVLLNQDSGLRLGYGTGQRPRNLVRYHKKWAEHYTDMDNNLSGIFSDLAAVHVINWATVLDLNDQLNDDQKSNGLNFRPNIIIEGPSAFEEDQWRYLKVGQVELKVGLEVLRCIETTVMPNGELNKEREPMKTLESYRKSKGPFGFGVMGIYLKVLKTGKIHEGDPVYVPV
ncbi:hypothetical protein ABEB36_003852 [Hypothenemus hampei]|uniref:MOSC domain-containing protein n=1 Tax=Hypothenemus hampei TaxID=57062 RepID=A0ABD1F414_HYPHA